MAATGRRSPAGANPAGAVSSRLQTLLACEQELWSRGVLRVAGVDEVGRGPLAGPVVAAAVIMPPGLGIEGVDDSKRLTPARRAALVEAVRAGAAALGVGAASAREIDHLNIRRATALAMHRAVTRLPLPPEHLVVDGLRVPELAAWPQTAVVGGDGLVHAVACASILAKVLRDRLMDRLALRYPGYGWERNKGYGTREHLEALLRLGVTPHHRRSFRPVGERSDHP